ncbi:hypothetical protein FACS189437_07860 [Bacteroidia bacterium]|nr:hypothetical protein FACS189437_07860 [Bacteroidia bacterium]
MAQNYFLDYLCEIGLASKKKITTITSKPSYPNQNARVPQGTRFYSDLTQYSIGIGIAKCESDNTRVVIPLLKVSPQQLKESPLRKRSSTILLLEKILEYLKSFDNQRGGIPFTGKQGGIGPGYHAQHPDNPVDADYLLAIGGAFLPGPGQSGLDMALAIKNLSDLVVELKQNEAEYEVKEKEILSQSNTDPSWRDKYAKIAEEAEAKEKEIIENKKKSSRSEKDNISETEKKYMYNGEKIQVTISHHIQKDTIPLWYGFGDRAGSSYLYNPGDTISKTIVNQVNFGNQTMKTIYYPARDTIYLK